MLRRRSAAFLLAAMKALTFALLMIAAATTGGAAQSTAHTMVQQTITFDDIAPRGMVLKQCWNAMGMDRQERVYIGFTASRADGREDFAVFRYDPATGDRRFLGSFMDVSEAAGNLRPGEEIPKGHTHFVELDGRMYMGSQGFHDLKEAIDILPQYRGSHLYAYDIAADRFEELSRSLPGGVATRHTGIIALAAVPGTHLLAGLEHPSSNIVLFDVSRGLAPKVVPGIPWRLGNPLSREIVATRWAKIYTYRGTEEPAQRTQSHSVWVHDLKRLLIIRSSRLPQSLCFAGGDVEAIEKWPISFGRSTVSSQVERFAIARAQRNESVARWIEDVNPRPRVRITIFGASIPNHFRRAA